MGAHSVRGGTHKRGWQGERAALAGGIDPRAGRATVPTLLSIWLEERQHAVSAKTYKSDAAVPQLVPTSLAVMQVGAVTDREVSRVLIALVRGGLAESSVKRFRDSLSAFFAWTVRERMIAVNPVTPTRVPNASAPRVEMYPYSAARRAMTALAEAMEMTASSADRATTKSCLISATTSCMVDPAWIWRTTQ